MCENLQDAACKKLPECQAIPKTASVSNSSLIGLLNGINPLVYPDYNLLNKNGQRLLHACLCAYAKHTLDSAEIGWDELSDTLTSAICETIGDDNFEEWLNSI